MSIAENIAAIREKIDAAARESGRTGADITLVGASKMNDASACREAIAAGIDVLGENRVQEMTAKLAENAYDGAPLHFIGHLQRNKVKQVVGKVAIIESVGSLELLQEIEKQAVQTGKKAATAADPEPNGDELDGDEMLPAAVDVILETGQASVSMLQRRLKLGYARAARIVDEMEEKGIVGPFQGSKPRAILITKEQWQAKKSGGEQQMDFDDIPFDDAVPEEID